MATRNDFNAAIAELNLVHFPTGSGMFPAPGYPGLGDLIMDALKNSPLEGFSGFDDGSGGTDPAKVIGYRDNGSCLRMTGPQSPSEGTATVSSYGGIFYNDAYSDTGLLKTRAIYGANAEMDLEVQGPMQVRITGGDQGVGSNGYIRMSSLNDIKIQVRAIGDVASSKLLLIDMVDTATIGNANLSDLVIKASSGNLRLNYGITDGAPVVPTLTTAQKNALAKVAGQIVFDSDTGKVEACDGSAWHALW